MTASLSVVIPAAGQGERLGCTPPKAAVSISGNPLLVHSIQPFLSIESLVEIVVVEPEDVSLKRYFGNNLQDRNCIRFTPGGATRLESVRNGVDALREGGEIVQIHDAARPFVPTGLIRRVLKQADDHGAAIPVLPIPDTVKRVSDGRVVETVDREGLYRAQTPQGIRRTLYETGLEQLSQEDREAVTDDASVLERTGIDVHTVEGMWRNFKITYPEDLERAEDLLNGAR